jgi:DNA-binding CsgD family transcriptional regulator
MPGAEAVHPPQSERIFPVLHPDAPWLPLDSSRQRPSSIRAKPMQLKSVEAIYVRWIFQGRSITDIARIEQHSIDEIQQRLDAICRRLGAASIGEAVERAKSSDII